MRPCRERFFALLLVLLSAVGLACTGTSATPSTVIVTGILVRADTLIEGKGCGRGATQVFKYAVVVLGRGTNRYLAGQVYDCFTDGAFVQLPDVNGVQNGTGAYDYDLQVFAFNEAGYLAAGDARVRSVIGDPAALRETLPTWTTTCGVSQLANVQALANCEPLIAGLSGLGTPAAPATAVLPVGSFAKADGGTLLCDADFLNVRARYRKEGSSTATDLGEQHCSTITGNTTVTEITVSPVDAPANYIFDVALLRSDGSVVGQTSCTAKTSPGRTSSAQCSPLQ